MTKSSTMLSIVLLLAFAQLMLAQPQDRKTIPCGQHLACKIGFSVCITDLSIVDEPECMDCWRWQMRTGTTCGTPSVHAHCNLYCEDLVRKDEKKKCTTEIGLYNRTSKAQLEQKESDNSQLRAQVLQTETDIRKLQEQLQEAKQIASKQEEDIRSLNEKLKAGQSSVDTDCNVFSQPWVLIGIILALVVVVVVVILMARLIRKCIKKYNCKRKLSSEMEPLNEKTDHKRDPEDMGAQNDDIMKVRNTPTAPLYTEKDETVSEDSNIPVYDNMPESEKTYGRGNTHKKGYTFENGNNSLRGNTPVDGNTPKTGSTPVDGNTPQTGNTPMGGNTPVGGNTPQAGNSPLSGNTPQSRNTPVAGSTPQAGNTPVGGNTPQAGNSPVGGNTPQIGNTPVGGNTPQAGNTPMIGNTPEAGNTPTGGNTPETGSTPINGNTPTSDRKICICYKFSQCSPSQKEEKVQVCSSCSSHS